MNSLTYVTLDLQAPNIAVVAAGKQNDLMSRKIACQLRDGDNAFTPPGGVAAMIRYAKPDGTVGFYDVLEDETTPAYSISGSVITITMCEQMLTVPGNVWVEINFYTSSEKLTTFYFLLEVQASVLSDGTIISSDYYNVLSAQIQSLLGATAHPVRIDSVTKNWLLWDEDSGAYVDSGYSSVGPAPVLESTTYAYSISDSGTVVPGDWHSTRPTPVQNKYLWTKATLVFSSGQTVYYTVAYQGRGSELDLLWTNPDPTNDFSAQTISLDLTNYGVVLIGYTSEPGGDDTMFSMALRGYTTALTYIYDNKYYRQAEVTINGVDFYDGYETLDGTVYTVASDSAIIPVVIYGFKGLI